MDHSQTALGLEFQIDVLEVGFDGIEGNVQPLGDLPVSQSLFEQRQQFDLARGEVSGIGADPSITDTAAVEAAGTCPVNFFLKS
jgi:hypothetical protein